MAKVRTRFAPSPTGLMHIGNFRTGLFAWLTARHLNGSFIIRLEDTDTKREVAGAEKHILDCFKALGIDYDEGPDVGGPYAPYVQSQRQATYKDWAQKLIDKGRAYADPYTPAEVQAFRDQAQAAKKPFLYRNHRPDRPPTWNGKRPLRFKSDPKPYKWHDEVMGDLSTGPEVIDDFILIKSDGLPTYNFAHIVDDATMDITHVIRGQEFLASIPNYLNLYEALELKPPIMATMPHVLGPDGKKKLSKRDGAKDVLDYLRQGYLPQALINFIASLGWNDGTEQEIFSREQLIKKFSLERVGRSGAKFDEQRLNWMNGYYIRQLPLDELYKLSEAFWPASAASYDDGYKKKVLALVQDRLKYLAELPALSEFFFKDLPIDKTLISGHKKLEKMASGDLKTLLETTRNSLADSDFTGEDLSNRLNALLTVTHTQPAVLFSLIRIATTQAPASPNLTDTLTVLGKGLSLKRLDKQIAVL